MADNAIGRRIKYFRKQKGLTQQELEVEAGLQFGSISRFESGKINPTKETIKQLAQALNLNNTEQSYLLGINIGRVKDQEVQEVKKYMRQYLETKENPINITDDTWFVHDWNKPTLDLFNMTSQQAEKFRGMHALNLIFNPEYPFRNSVPDQYWPTIATYQIAFFQREVKIWANENWYETLIKDLMRIKDFSNYWEEAQKLDSDQINAQEKMFVCKNQNGQPLVFHVSDYRIDKYPRFSLVEYIKTV